MCVKISKRLPQLVSSLVLWVESYLLRPNLFQKFISFLLLPFAAIYCIIVTCKRKFANPKDYEIATISIGNLTIGGSGKTPLILSLAKDIKKPAIILRGYKRASKGLHVISYFGELKHGLHVSGDEAMLYSKMLSNAIVIVSEDRVKAIKKAKELGAKAILLDDGFSKANIKKFDILIEPNPLPKNSFCLPSGGYREPKSFEKYADLILQEQRDFTRVCTISNKSDNMVLVTAIANASRLDKYLPKEVTSRYVFPDHYQFDQDELKKILHVSRAKSILTTRKDWVKMLDFELPLSFLELEIVINDSIKKQIFSELKQPLL